MSGVHTPGPWRVGKAVNGNWIEAGHTVQPVTVARTIYEHVGALVEDANAQLIAAAPDLLEALQEIADAHLGDQPASSAGTEYDWACRHIGRLRGTALKAIARAQSPVA